MTVVDNTRYTTLITYVQARRSDLNMRSRSALAKTAGVSARTVTRLEQGESVSVSSRRLIERALQWQYRSIEAILDGREPVPTETVGSHVSEPSEEPPLETHVDGAPFSSSAVRALAAMLLAVWQDEGHDALRAERQRLREQLDPETMRAVMHEWTVIVTEASTDQLADHLPERGQSNGDTG